MKTLVIGDIHNKIDVADHIIKHSARTHQHSRVIFMGDYFDAFHDTTDDARRTAQWLKSSLLQQERIHLVGNHDFQYLLDHRKHETLICSGFSTDKYKTINQVLHRDDWNKLIYFHVEQGWWLSHAGITRKWFEHPVLGLNEHVVRQSIQHDINLIDMHQVPLRLWAADRRRGGTYEQGGLLWCDWSNLHPIPNVKQIVGHTQHKRVQYRKSNSATFSGGEAYCLDTLNQYIILHEGKVTIFDTPL